MLQRLEIPIVGVVLVGSETARAVPLLRLPVLHRTRAYEPAATTA